MHSQNILIQDAVNDEAILRCFPVMSQLRPHLLEADFVERVKCQQAQGYRLACLENSNGVQALAGYRFLENLAWGRFCYVDDLVTNDATRSSGFGQQILDWVRQRAREQGCAQFHLDSGVQRFGAHRFYLAQRMDITCHHFAMKLEE